MDGRCATCKYWHTELHWNTKHPAYQPQGGSEFDSRPQPGVNYDGMWGNCELATYQNGYFHPESLALSRDLEQYESYLVTRPDFGCVQYTARSADDKMRKDVPNGMDTE